MSKIVNILLATIMLTAAATSLAAGDADAGKSKSAVCAACHGSGGISATSANPNIAGQVPGYISAQLAEFKSGNRVNAVMQAQTQGLSEEDMDDLDAYYSSLPANMTSAALSEADLEQAKLGEKIYRGGFRERGISACMSCHGPSGHGIPKNYPRVSSQHKEYLQQQLLAYKDESRKGYNEIMSKIAFGLSAEQIEQLSIYMASLR